ncbi:MAG: TolC family protein, partial [Armatimonadota bacterium]|nr:TolC family protein [Armatimonadota bacterium]
MRSLRIDGLIVLLILAGQAILPASNSSISIPTDRPLTLQECISIALQNHSSVLVAKKSIEASKAGLKQARAGYLPDITLGTDYSKSGYEGGQVGTGLRRVGTFENEQTTIGLSQTFLDGGRTKTAIRQASAQERIAEAELEMTKQERILAVTQAYFKALLTKRLVDIADQTVKEAEKQLEMIKARIEAGDAARVDLYPVEVQVANAKLNKLQADNNARIAANALRNAMGLEKGPELQITDVKSPEFSVPSLEECMTSALRNRPELARSTAQIDSAKAALSLARQQLLPVPSASLNYDRGLAGSGYDSQWSIGARLSFNVFDGGALRAQVESNKARVESLRLTIEQLNKDIANEVEEAHLNLTNALERLSASKANVELTRTNLEV